MLLLNFKSEEERFTYMLQKRVTFDLKENEKLIKFELIDDDSLSQEQVQNFIKNYSYTKMVEYQNLQTKFGENIKEMDTIKTVEGINEYLKVFDKRMKMVSDSFNFYSKICDKAFETAGSKNKILKTVRYHLVIKDEVKNIATDRDLEIFIDREKIFTVDAFFKYQVEKLEK